jgi:hypothetical protein
MLDIFEGLNRLTIQGPLEDKRPRYSRACVNSPGYRINEVVPVVKQQRASSKDEWRL